MSLAKLKMHIQDKHLCAGETKKRMKHFFGKASAVSLAQAVSQQCIVPAPLLINKTETDDAMVIDPTLQQSPDRFANECDQFNKLTSSFGRQAAGYDRDGQMPLEISIKIADLFNFMNTGWILVHKHSVSQSLDGELELYELLDTDAPSHNHINVKIDPALDSVLHHV